jgi:hypothetical protein
MLCSSALCIAQTKPLVLIQGTGNISIQSTGQAGAGVVGDAVVGANAHQATINKHDQTMEIAHIRLESCPSIETTLDGNASVDYIVHLNREGAPTIFGEIGKSQIMVLNAHKSPIFVSKKATVKNAVKSACNAVSADWQEHGRIQPLQPAQQVPPAQPQESPSPAPASPVIESDVAVVMQKTAAAEKRCKPETISSVLSDTVSYLTGKGFTIGTSDSAHIKLTLIVDRPMSKWLEITVQGRDRSGNLLWSEKVGDGSSFHLGTTGALVTLEKVHKVIDSRLVLPQGGAVGK